MGEAVAAGTSRNNTAKQSINAGAARTYELIDRLRERETVTLICSFFDVATSSYYDYMRRSQVIDVKRLHLQAKLKELFR